MPKRKDFCKQSWNESDNEFKKDNLLFYLQNTLQSMQQIYNEELFEITLNFLSSQYKQKTFADIKKFTIRIKMDVDYIFESYKDGDTNLDDTLTDFFRKWPIRKKFQKIIMRKIFELKCGDVKENTSFSNRTKSVQELFQLNEMEKNILMLYFHIETDNQTAKLVELLNEYLNVKTARFGSNLTEYSIAILLNEKRINVRKALQSSASLVKFGILDSEREITNEIMNYLEGIEDKPIMQHYFRNFDDDCIPINEHLVKKNDLEIISELFKNKTSQKGVNILLYGEPGTGKTEFARSLSKHLKTKLYQINSYNQTENNEKKEDINHFRIRAFIACQNTINEEKSIILVDESDSMLNSIPQFFLLKNTTDKGQINNLLDESQAFTIWITNYVDGMDESTRRRFNHSIKFERLNFNQRHQLWMYKMKEYNVKEYFNEQDINYLCENYEINAGGIDIAMKNISSIHKNKANKELVLSQLEHILSSYELLLGRKNNKNKKQIKSNYSLDGLNTNVDMNELIKSLQGFNEQWNDYSLRTSSNNINLLLFGPSGTGKTEFSKFLMQKLKRRLVTKRASDLLSPYVGMSERLIREAFEQAENEKAILLIDEVDSFLFTRENAGRMWELSLVNELLTNMENFKGIFIATTNLKQMVDNASIRRFTHKIKFDYLSDKGNLIFYNIFMTKLVNKSLSSFETNRIEKMSHLTPGDFKVVSNMFGFRKNIKHEEIITALENEIEIKNLKRTKIGF